MMNFLLFILHTVFNCITLLFRLSFSQLMISVLTAFVFATIHLFRVAFPPTLVKVPVFVPAIIISMITFATTVTFITPLQKHRVHFKGTA